MAWTGNFKDQISALTNGIPDEGAAAQWTLDGCYDVIERAVQKSGSEEIWKFAINNDSDIEAATVDIDEARTIVAVMRDGKFATKGQWQLAEKYGDTNSIYKTTDNHPIWWIDDSKLTISPAASEDDPARYYYIPEYSITQWGTSISSIGDYPSEYYYHAMLYTAIKVMHAKMTAKTVTEQPSFILSAVIPPKVPTSIVSAPDIDNINAANITEELPIYLSQSIGGSVLGELATQTIADLSPSAAPPSVPSLATVSYSSVTEVQMEAIGTIAVNDIATVTDTLVLDTDASLIDESEPSYSIEAPTIPPNVQVELDKMKDFVNEEEDPEMSRAKMEEIQAILSSYPLEIQSFQARVSESKNLYDKENVIYQAKIQQAMQNVQNHNTIAIQNMQKDMTTLQQNLSKNIDIEKTNVGNDMNRKQINIQQQHAALMQNAIQEMQEIVSNNASLLQKHQEEKSLYNAQIDNDVKVYQQNVQKITNLWQQTNTFIFQEFQARAGEELNRYNAENVKYQAHVQSIMAKYQGDLQVAQKEGDYQMQRDIQNYTFSLEKWQKEVSAYSAEVNAQIGEYTQNLQKYQAELQITPVEYQWLQDQYNRLKLEYEQLFGAGQVAPATQ